MDLFVQSKCIVRTRVCVYIKFWGDQLKTGIDNDSRMIYGPCQGPWVVTCSDYFRVTRVVEGSGVVLRTTGVRRCSSVCVAPEGSLCADPTLGRDEPVCVRPT